MHELFQQGHALIIGAGFDLPNTIQDALGIAAIFKDAGRCAYPLEHVHTLTGSAASRDAVLLALDTLAQTTNEDSTVLIYYSGHGYQISTSSSDSYFMLPYGYDIKRLKQTAISGSEFTTKLRAIPAKKLLVLLDCCHVGGVGEAKFAQPSVVGIEAMSKAPLPSEALPLLSDGYGRVLIASSREGEKSYAGKPYSAFTLALIESFSGVGVAKKDGYVRVSDIALHVREVVPKRTWGRQHPILHFEHADNFVLAYYAGGEALPKGLPFDVEPEIEPEPGAWRDKITLNGDGAINTGSGNALGAGAVQAHDVNGDLVMGDKKTGIDQRGQKPHHQINVAGDFIQNVIGSGEAPDVPYGEKSNEPERRDGRSSLGRDEEVDDEEQLFENRKIESGDPHSNPDDGGEVIMKKKSMGSIVVGVLVAFPFVFFYGGKTN